VATDAQIISTHQTVKVSTSGSLVNFQIDDQVPLEVACREFREHLGRFRELYARGEVTVDIGRRLLADDQRSRIQKVIQSESGLSIRQFWCDPAILEAERLRIAEILRQQAWLIPNPEAPADPNDSPPPDAPTDASDPEPEEPDLAVGKDGEPVESYDSAASSQDSTAALDADQLGAPAWIVRGTFRAGEVFRIPGSVVVLGNVNPGAQIIADGDIVVFGTLRGLAHAGAAGDAAATITAMSASKPDLRIAGYRWEPDDPGELTRPGTGKNPAIVVRVCNLAMHVSPYQKNYGINHGGNPNDR
jgi:septum formation inhibitor MinC